MSTDFITKLSLSEPASVQQGLVHNALGTITRAFASDPFFRWVYPSDDQYFRYFPALARALGGSGTIRGATRSETGTGSAAIFLGPGQDPYVGLLSAILDGSALPERRPESMDVMAQVVSKRPAEPHVFLPIFGVDPDAQVAGCGAALLTSILAECDLTTMPVYLIATRSRVVSALRHRGFEVSGKFIIHGFASVVTMRRQPVLPLTRQGETLVLAA